LVRWLEFEFDVLDFTDVTLLFPGESLPLLTQPIVKYGARVHAKERRPWSFIRPELDSSQQMIQYRVTAKLTLNLPTLNIIANVLWTSSIDLAANAESGTENLLNTTLELL
jgi:hypothetical protein